MEKEKLTKKWLNEGLDPAEEKAFNELGDVQLQRAIVENAKHFKASGFSEADGFDIFKKKLYGRKPVKKSNRSFPFLKMAGIFIFAIGAYFALSFFSSTKIETLAGEKTTIELPDNSKVSLNALSSIEYRAFGWENDRTLTLVGEAYFKVAKGKTFEVQTESGTVTVVGTEFNVKQRAGYFEVNCFEGTVQVSSAENKMMLQAGDTYRLLNGKFSERKTAAAAPAWVSNHSDFETVPFKEVLAELERQYGIRIAVENVDTQRLFTGSFVNDNLGNALIAVTQPMDLTFERNSNQVTIREKKD